MRFARGVRLLACAAMVATTVPAVVGAPAAHATTIRDYTDSPRDGGFVATPHAKVHSYTVGAHRQVALTVAGAPTTGATGATGLTVALAVTAKTAGSLTLWPVGTPRPAGTGAFGKGRTALSTVVAPGPQDLLNNSSKPITVTVRLTGYYPVATTAVASGAPGGFVATPARRVVDTTLKPRQVLAYKTTKAAPPEGITVVLQVTATATKSGTVTSNAWHSPYKWKATLPLRTGVTTTTVQVVHASGIHWVGFTNNTKGRVHLVVSALGYLVHFHAPSQAQYIKATPAPAGATVTWQPPGDLGGLPITGYIVSVLNGSNWYGTPLATYPVDGGTLSATVPTPTGRDVYLGVTAINAAGTGGIWFTQFPIHAAPPTAPRTVSATSDGAGHVRLTWAPPAGDVSWISSYRITGTRGQQLDLPASATTATFDLGAGLALWLRVSACSIYTCSDATVSNRVVGLGSPPAGVVTRVSVTPENVSLGDNPFNQSGSLAVSSGGRYAAFASDSAAFVTGDTNNAYDVFVRDLQSGTTTRVSVTSSGAQADGDSWNPVMSADGRYVAFTSTATDLDPRAGDGQPHVYRHDLQTGATVLVSVTADGSAGRGWTPSISADGGRVAFGSDSALTAQDDDSVDDVYLRDLAAGTTTLVSVATSGARPDHGCEDPAISADGNAVAFTSSATTLATGPDGTHDQVFVRDLTAGTTTWASPALSGSAGDGDVEWPVLSGDGRSVAFVSNATDLVSGGTTSDSHAYVRSLSSATTTLVSIDPTGAVVSAYDVSISADGNRVAMTLERSGDPSQVYVRALGAAATTLVSTAGGAPAEGAGGAFLSPDGHFLAFDAIFVDEQVDGDNDEGIFEAGLG